MISFDQLYEHIYSRAPEAIKTAEGSFKHDLALNQDWSKLHSMHLFWCSICTNLTTLSMCTTLIPLIMRSSMESCHRQRWCLKLNVANISRKCLKRKLSCFDIVNSPILIVNCHSQMKFHLIQDRSWTCFRFTPIFHQKSRAVSNWAPRIVDHYTWVEERFQHSSCHLLNLNYSNSNFKNLSTGVQERCQHTVHQSFRGANSWPQPPPLIQFKDSLHKFFFKL